MHPLFSEYIKKRTGKTKTIAVIGGPKAGKSTILKALETKYSNEIVFITETATHFLSSGLTQPPANKKRTDRWLTRLQPAIILTQVLRELEAYDDAQIANSPTKMIIHDRGTADALVYLPGKYEEFQQIFQGLDINHLFNRYDIVIHLESLATANPSLFNKEGNQIRYENIQDAKRIELDTQTAWKDHPNYYFLPGKNGLEVSQKKVFEIIDSYLS